MRIFLYFYFIGFTLFSCEPKKRVELDLPLEIISSDTIYLNAGYLQYQNAKFHVSDKKNFLIVHQDRKLWRYDIEKNYLMASLDLDTLPLVLPEVGILHARFFEKDCSLSFFFPQRSKIIKIDSNYQIVDEIQLNGLTDIDLTFTAKGDHYFEPNNTESVFIGTRSILSNNPEIYLNKTKFIAQFNLKTGDLNKTFGQYGQKRKALMEKIMAEGTVLIDYDKDKFYFREVAGDPSIRVYNTSGEKKEEYLLGTRKISYQLYPLIDGDFFNSQSSDQFYSMKVISNKRVVSNTFSRKKINGQFQFESFLVVEDLEDMKSYSTEIPAFQKVVYATDTIVYLVSNHPTKEDLILVKLEYRLGGDK
jgi:hypothetical protein